MKFISFYTPNGSYPVLARQLETSLKKFNLDYDIELFESFDSWLSGVDNKAKFIKNKLLKYKDTVVWLDIDTEIKRFPELLFGNEQLALFNWFAVDRHVLQQQAGFPFDPNTEQMLNGGAVSKWSHTPKCIELLDLWVDCLQRPHETDDQMLDVAWNLFDHKNVNYRWLPESYNVIESMFTDRVDPVILHHFKDKAHRDSK